MIYISPSSLNNYKQCHYKYYWANVLKFKEEQSMDMKLGSSVHMVLQTHGQKIIDNHGELYKEDIKKMLTSENVPSILMSDSSIVQRWVDIFKLVYDNYSDIFNPNAFSLENFIDKVYINDRCIGTGKYDRLDFFNDEKTIVCVDYKTGKINEQGFEMDFQFIMYSKFLFNRFKEEKKRIKIIGFKNGYNTFTKDASISNWQMILDYVGQIENEHNYDPCQGNLCNWCGAQKSCPLFGGKDIRENMLSKVSTVPQVVAPSSIDNLKSQNVTSRFKVKEKVVEIEKDACPECGKMIDITSIKCPECGVEFESNGKGAIA